MYKYKLIKNDYNGDIQKIFDDYFPERAEHTKNLINDESLIRYFMCAFKENEVVGVMGIVYQNYYKLSNLVVKKEYENNGIGTALIRMGIKSIIDLGGEKIRNHKRE